MTQCEYGCPDGELCVKLKKHIRGRAWDIWNGKVLTPEKCKAYRNAWSKRAGLPLETAVSPVKVVVADIIAMPASPVLVGNKKSEPVKRKFPEGYFRLPCIYLGEPTGETRDCKVCGGGVNIPLHGCAVHKQCSPGKRITDVAWCATCKDKVVRQDSAPVPSPVYFVRHAESEANAGRTKNLNSPITAHGREQAIVAARHLANRNLSGYQGIVSPLLRTQQTAEQISRVTGLKFETWPELRDWSGDVTVDGVIYRHESGEEVTARCGRAWDRIRGKKYVVVSHEAPLRVLRQLAQGMNPDIRGSMKVENAKVYVVPEESPTRTAFDRVYLVNLKSRTDRLENFRKLQKERGWQLPEPIIFPAISGDTVGVPKSFTQGGGALGCRQSHTRILEMCLMDGVNSVLVMEDDVEWFEDAWLGLAKFMQAVPADWEQLMLGGQHQKPPERISESVAKVRQTERTHAYALRGDAIRSLLGVWYESKVHIDWDMGRIWQKDHKVYAPTPFLFGQGSGRSDISGRTNPAQYWIEPKDYPVVVLHCPPEVVKGLRSQGFHTGFTRNAEDVDIGLEKLVHGAASQRKSALRKWVHMIAWECASMKDSHVTVWHPEITADMVRRVHDRVIEIKADTTEEALRQFREGKS